MSFVRVRSRITKKVLHGRCDIQKTHHQRTSFLPRDKARGGNRERHVDVFLVHVKRMAVVAIVLAKGFAVIADHDPQNVVCQSACVQSAHQRSE